MLARLIVRIAAWNLPKELREKYLRAWLAELELINQENPSESLAFATSLLRNIKKMREVNSPKNKKPIRRLADFALAGATFAALLVTIIQFSSSPPSIISKSDSDIITNDFEQVVSEEESVGRRKEEESTEVREREEEFLDSEITTEVLAPEVSVELSSVPESESAPPPAPQANYENNFAVNSGEPQDTPTIVTPNQPRNTLNSIKTDNIDGNSSTPNVPNNPNEESEIGVYKYFEPTYTNELEVIDEELPALEDSALFNEGFGRAARANSANGPRPVVGSTQDELESDDGVQLEETIPLSQDLESKGNGLEEVLWELARDYEFKNKASKQEALVFIQILAEMIELDEQATKKYLKHLLGVVRDTF